MRNEGHPQTHLLMDGRYRSTIRSKSIGRLHESFHARLKSTLHRGGCLWRPVNVILCSSWRVIVGPSLSIKT